jgi:hypothetical protein
MSCAISSAAAWVETETEDRRPNGLAPPQIRADQTHSQSWCEKKVQFTWLHVQHALSQ